jgi:hypothetical protein
MLILRDFDWSEFFERLGGPEGLKPANRGRTRALGLQQQIRLPARAQDTCRHGFKQHNGHCDCEVMLNVMFAMQSHDAMH